MAAVLTTMSTPPNSRTVFLNADLIVSRWSSRAPPSRPSPRSRVLRRPRRRLLRTCRIRVGNHDVTAAPGNLQRNLASDTAAAADDHGDSTTQLPLRWHALELRLFECPVSIRKASQPRQRDIVLERLELFRLFRTADLRQHRVGEASSVLPNAFAPAITWIAFTKNSVVIRASRLSFPNPNNPNPGMTTTDGLLSRSFGESGSANAFVIGGVFRPFIS